jgi:hypothetical protein
MAQYNDIPRGGMIETIEAKLYARYGQFSDTYLTKMLRGAAPPKHVYVMAERFKKERPWEQPDKAPAPKKANWMDSVPSVAVPSAPAAPQATAKTEAPRTGPKSVSAKDWWDSLPVLSVPSRTMPAAQPVAAPPMPPAPATERGSAAWWQAAAKAAAEKGAKIKAAEDAWAYDSDDIPF